MNRDKEKPPISIETLNEHLEAVKRFKTKSPPPKKLPGDAARSAIDFASASAVGSLLGYGLDAWQNTDPWGLLLGLTLGTAAGLKLMFQNEARERGETETETESKH